MSSGVRGSSNNVFDSRLFIIQRRPQVCQLSVDVDMILRRAGTMRKYCFFEMSARVYCLAVGKWFEPLGTRSDENVSH